MTDESRESTESGKGRPEWVDEAEEALGRVGDAVRAAWEATRDTRVSALESAKQAAKQLGEALDKGIDTARQRWQAAEGAAVEEE